MQAFGPCTAAAVQPAAALKTGVRIPFGRRAEEEYEEGMRFRRRPLGGGCLSGIGWPSIQNFIFSHLKSFENPGWVGLQNHPPPLPLVSKGLSRILWFRWNQKGTFLC